MLTKKLYVIGKILDDFAREIRPILIYIIILAIFIITGAPQEFLQKFASGVFILTFYQVSCIIVKIWDNHLAKYVFKKRIKDAVCS